MGWNEEGYAKCMQKKGGAILPPLSASDARRYGYSAFLGLTKPRKPGAIRPSSGINGRVPEQLAAVEIRQPPAMLPATHDVASLSTVILSLACQTGFTPVRSFLSPRRRLYEPEALPRRNMLRIPQGRRGRQDGRDEMQSGRHRESEVKA